MPGTKAGSIKAQETMKRVYGEEGRIAFFRRIGQIGGKKSTNGGFASTKVGADGLTGYERARLAGQKGGKISKRGKAKREQGEEND